MDKFSVIRIILKCIALVFCYFLLFIIVYVTDTVPYLEQAFSGDFETTDAGAQALLSFLRILFYFLIPTIITLFEMFIIGRKFFLFFRRLIETINIFYLLLYLVKAVYFFTAMDKKFGFTILEGLDFSIFIISTIVNVYCYKKPSFLIASPHKKDEDLNVSK